MARPKANINPEQVEELAKFGCTNTEIAEFFGVSEKTIRARFSEILTKGRAGLKQRLRKKQIELAMKGNATMLIWLGKQYLEQSDKTESFETVKQTVFTYDSAVAGITRRSKGNSGPSSPNESSNGRAEMGQVLHGGGDVFGNS